MEQDSNSLRFATSGDLEALVEIERRAHTFSQPWTFQNFSAELKKSYSRFLVLTDDETDSIIYGYLIYWTSNIGGNDTDTFQILNIVVHPDYRGLGHGKKMMHHLINDATRSGAKKILLEVNRLNEAAIQLYHLHRFEITQVRKNFYSNGGDAYVMELSIHQ